jgi:phage repressor protein C with HTH and peptisase S24 domain
LIAKRRKLPPYPGLIERLRRDIGITQTALAQRLSVSAMSVSRWERGVQEPSSQMFVKLGTLASGEMRWVFWEYAGLHRSQVEAPSSHQIVVSDPKNLAHRAHGVDLVPIPLLDARLGASLHGDFISGCDVLEVLTAPSDWCPHPDQTICAFVDGDSMEPRIRDGSVVCIDASDKSPASLAGHIVVAQHPRLGTKLSWFEVYGDGYIFRSENPKNEPMPFEGEWKLIGRMLWWLTRTPAK